MKKLLRFAGIASIIGIVAIAVTACGHHRHDPEEKAEWVVKKITRKLDLNEDQQGKLKAVSDEFLAHHKEHRARKMEHLDKLVAEIRKPELDKTVLSQMVEEHQTHVANLAPAVIEKLAIFHASLDDEQKEELIEKIEHFKEHHSDHADD